MENIPFKSIDEVDDISTLDEYKVALDAGLTPEAALKAVAAAAATMPVPPCSGLVRKMPDLQLVHRGFG